MMVSCCSWAASRMRRACDSSRSCSARALASCTHPIHSASFALALVIVQMLHKHPLFRLQSAETAVLPQDWGRAKNAGVAREVLVVWWARGVQCGWPASRRRCG